MSKQKKGKKHSKKKPFDIKIENLFVQLPALRSQDSGIERQFEKQKRTNKILYVLLLLSAVFQSGLIQMYVDNWDVIEPVSQLIEWIITIVTIIMKIK